MDAQLDMPSHPYAALFPVLEGAELEVLAKDIAEHGLREPITLLDGQVLDGRNRLAACRLAGVEPQFREWQGEGSPVAWVISVNLHRRHLSTGQRAIAAARASEMFKAEARERQLSGLRQNRSTVPANLREREESTLSESERTSAARGAKLFGVSPRTTEFGRKVLRDGHGEVVEAVERNQLAVSTAATLSDMPKDEQRELVARGKKEILRLYRQIRAEDAAKRREERARLAEEIRQEPPPPPKGPFRVIVVDPPWRYGRASDPSHRARNPYPDLTVEEICTLDVARLAHEDCVLWLWTTNAFMADAYRCLDAWGFTPKTILTWDKVRMGLGDWLRNVTEHCILAVRGKPIVEAGEHTTLISESRREHSRKPEAFYQLVEALCPGSKLEMFARQEREGWTAWGAETRRFEHAAPA